MEESLQLLAGVTWMYRSALGERAAPQASFHPAGRAHFQKEVGPSSVVGTAQRNRCDCAGSDSYLCVVWVGGWFAPLASAIPCYIAESERQEGLFRVFGS